MNAIAAENIVIGTLAGIGVLVLLVMFVYVVRLCSVRKGNRLVFELLQDIQNGLRQGRSERLAEAYCR